MDVEGVSPRREPSPRSQGAGGACPAPPPPPQPQPPAPPQQLARDDLPGGSAGAEDRHDPDPRPNGEKGESKGYQVQQGDGYHSDLATGS
nr:monocarboxylate transporter 8-like [Dasypus novemcinctus]